MNDWLAGWVKCTLRMGIRSESEWGECCGDTIRYDTIPDVVLL